jgi:hypothetical protein
VHVIGAHIVCVVGVTGLLILVVLLAFEHGSTGGGADSINSMEKESAVRAICQFRRNKL